MILRQVTSKRSQGKLLQALLSHGKSSLPSDSPIQTAENTFACQGSKTPQANFRLLISIIPDLQHPSHPLRRSAIMERTDRSTLPSQAPYPPSMTSWSLYSGGYRHKTRFNRILSQTDPKLHFPLSDPTLTGSE